MLLNTCAVERLTRDAFARLERDAPMLLGALQRAIVRLQADRLRSANAETLALPRVKPPARRDRNCGRRRPATECSARAPGMLAAFIAFPNALGTKQG